MELERKKKAIATSWFDQSVTTPRAFAPFHASLVLRCYRTRLVNRPRPSWRRRCDCSTPDLEVSAAPSTSRQEHSLSSVYIRSFSCTECSSFFASSEFDDLTDVAGSVVSKGQALAQLFTSSIMMREVPHPDISITVRVLTQEVCQHTYHGSVLDYCRMIITMTSPCRFSNLPQLC